MIDKTINWKYLGLAYFTLFSLGFIDNMRGPAYPEILQHFQIAPNFGSLIYTLASLAGLIITVTARWWLFPLGTLASIRIFLFTISSSSFCMGWVISSNYQFFWFLASSFLLGCSLGGIGVAANIMITQSTPMLYRRNAYSGFHAMYGISSLLAPLFFTLSQLYLKISWSTPFKIIAAAPILLCIYSFFIPKIQTKDDPSVQNTTSNVKWSHRLSIGLFFGLYVAAELSLSSRLVYYLKNSLAWDISLCAFYLSLFFTSLLSGRLIFTFFRFSWKSYHVLVTSAVLSFFLYLFGLLYFPILLPICGFSMSIFFPTAMTWLAENYKTDFAFMISSVMTAVGASLIGMHWLIGFLSSNFGIGNALFVGPIFLIFAMIFLLIANKIHGQKC
ncbi:MAG: MFS transporter [Bacteriovoracaceae bacterium]|nr:MFS transporter [Bacteriovoracaceae bacterium]